MVSFLRFFFKLNPWRAQNFKIAKIRFWAGASTPCTPKRRCPLYLTGKDTQTPSTNVEPPICHTPGPDRAGVDQFEPKFHVEGVGP